VVDGGDVEAGGGPRLGLRLGLRLVLRLGQEDAGGEEEGGGLSAEGTAGVSHDVDLWGSVSRAELLSRSLA